MKYKMTWQLTPTTGHKIVRQGSAEIELDDDEIGVLPHDLSPDHPLRPLLEICGPVPVILQCRWRGGERVNVPTLEFITKSARVRRRASLTQSE